MAQGLLDRHLNTSHESPLGSILEPDPNRGAARRIPGIELGGQRIDLERDVARCDAGGVAREVGEVSRGSQLGNTPGTPIEPQVRPPAPVLLGPDGPERQVGEVHVS